MATKKNKQLTGKEVRELRESKRIKAIDVACATNVAASAISLFERHEQPLNEDSYDKVVEYLKSFKK